MITLQIGRMNWNEETKSSKTSFFAGREMMKALTKKQPQGRREGAKFESNKIVQTGLI